jgi:hypothetical protein
LREFVALLSPSQIHQVIKESQPQPDTRVAGELGKLLSKHNLTPDDALERLAGEMNDGANAGIRLRAVETALKLNGLLNSAEMAPDFHVTINILDSEFSGMNPILIPR